MTQTCRDGEPWGHVEVRSGPYAMVGDRGYPGEIFEFLQTKSDVLKADVQQLQDTAQTKL